VFPFSSSRLFSLALSFSVWFGLGSLFNLLGGIYSIWIRIGFLPVLMSDPCYIKQKVFYKIGGL
jgi:hypothetical protein